MSDPKDWDKRLAEIDRAMARLPEPKPTPVPTGPTAPPALPGKPGQRSQTTATWLRVVLVVVLALAMPFWPYGRGCGFGLFAYLGAASVLLVGAVWAAIWTWRTHQAIAHILALLVTGWALGLLISQVLPRVGYAGQAVRWVCG